MSLLFTPTTSTTSVTNARTSQGSQTVWRGTWGLCIWVKKRLSANFVASYNTSTKKALQVHHMALHSGQRPYKCTRCDYASVNSSHLKRHVNTMHSEPYLEQCEHCDFMAERESTTFRNHLVTMHPDQKTYKCTVWLYNAAVAQAQRTLNGQTFHWETVQMWTVWLRNHVVAPLEAAHGVQAFRGEASTASTQLRRHCIPKDTSRKYMLGRNLTSVISVILEPLIPRA